MNYLIIELVPPGTRFPVFREMLLVPKNTGFFFFSRMAMLPMFVKYTLGKELIDKPVFEVI